ncbi:MAG TPA: aspartate kinase, partial [Saprospiraceae bacterium]|nr:aspartate kinase [Saprospiraceae bacterium]
MNTDTVVFKFGGASVRDAAAVRNVAKILTQHKGPRTVVIVSAMGKMTNALEELTHAHFERSPEAQAHLKKIREYHWRITSELFDEDHEVFAQLNDHFVEMEWLMSDPQHNDFDFLYDQLVSYGELLSTRIVSAYLQMQGVDCTWLDARDVVKTDNTWREARIDWSGTQAAMNEKVNPLLDTGSCVLTQGFIGCTSENFTTTLGREGSDYTAAIFAYCLDAKSMTVWKDVPGVLTADPQLFENTSLINRMSYREAIEMTYYGATVIHPKTIQPLQNKSIPLYVRSFQNHEEQGTWIGTDMDAVIPPVIVYSDKQAMMRVATRDYSFMAEHHLSNVFALFAKHRIKVNMMRNTAISFIVCCRQDDDRIERIAKDLEKDFIVTIDKDLSLLTVRHYNKSTIDALTSDKTIVLEERFKDTAQFVLLN